MRCHHVVVAMISIAALFAQAAPAGTDGTPPSPDPNQYFVVFHHQIVIQAPAAAVWPHLINPSSWIDFDFIHVSGPRLQEGEIYRLYEGQDFSVQTTKMIPNQLFVSVNLPSTFQGEDSTGIAVFSLAEIDGKTVVNVTMSREYRWTGEGENATRKVRESAEFNENTRAAWEKRFLPKLRALAEIKATDKANPPSDRSRATVTES